MLAFNETSQQRQRDQQFEALKLINFYIPMLKLHSFSIAMLLKQLEALLQIAPLLCPIEYFIVVTEAREELKEEMQCIEDAAKTLKQPQQLDAITHNTVFITRLSIASTLQQTLCERLKNFILLFPDFINHELETYFKTLNEYIKKFNSYKNAISPERPPTTLEEIQRDYDRKQQALEFNLSNAIHQIQKEYVVTEYFLDDALSKSIRDYCFLIRWSDHLKRFSHTHTNDHSWRYTFALTKLNSEKNRLLKEVYAKDDHFFAMLQLAKVFRDDEEAFDPRNISTRIVFDMEKLNETIAVLEASLYENVPTHHRATAWMSNLFARNSTFSAALNYHNGVAPNYVLSEKKIMSSAGSTLALALIQGYCFNVPILRNFIIETATHTITPETTTIIEIGASLGVSQETCLKAEPALDFLFNLLAQLATYSIYFSLDTSTIAYGTINLLFSRGVNYLLNECLKKNSQLKQQPPQKNTKSSDAGNENILKTILITSFGFMSPTLIHWLSKKCLPLLLYILKEAPLDETLVSNSKLCHEFQTRCNRAAFRILGIKEQASCSIIKETFRGFAKEHRPVHPNPDTDYQVEIVYNAYQIASRSRKC